LSQLQSNRGLWIITGDADFRTEHDGKRFLNALIYKRLQAGIAPTLLEPDLLTGTNVISLFPPVVFRRNRIAKWMQPKLSPESQKSRRLAENSELHHSFFPETCKRGFSERVVERAFPV